MIRAWNSPGVFNSSEIWFTKQRPPSLYPALPSLSLSIPLSRSLFSRRASRFQTFSTSFDPPSLSDNFPPFLGEGRLEGWCDEGRITGMKTRRGVERGSMCTHGLAEIFERFSLYHSRDFARETCRPDVTIVVITMRVEMLQYFYCNSAYHENRKIISTILELSVLLMNHTMKHIMKHHA